ncbi:hypothetical protein ACFYO5_24415 [Streptomyces sp. NPDC006259]|uniref:hypothetical protein n=1 Tax=Streptomyces sp. NPDC006259 TaxID=3364740 RepID=UPI00367C8AB0
MNDNDPKGPTPDLTHSPNSRKPAEEPTKPRYAVLDGIVLFALLGMCAGVYRTVGNAGFSAIIGAAAGLYGTWRARR